LQQAALAAAGSRSLQSDFFRKRFSRAAIEPGKMRLQPLRERTL